MNNYNLAELFEKRKDIREVFMEFMSQQFVNFLEKLGEIEREIHCTVNEDSKNGHYTRNFDTFFGKIEGVKIPRTRRTKFHPSFLEPYKRTTFELDEIVLSMYQGGCSTKDIVRTLENLLGQKYSPRWVSKITDDILEEIEKYHNRRFDRWYPVLFIDGTYLKLRRDTVSSEVVYTVMGIDEEGHKEILSFYLFGGSGESALNWKELLYELRERGLQEPVLVIADGLKGIKEAVLEVYPKVDFQSCVVHKVRSSLSKIRKYDESAVTEDMKNIYMQETEEGFLNKYKEFCKKWSVKYPEMIALWEKDLPELMTYLKYPALMRPYIYTTNPLERFHKEVKRRTKVIEVFNDKKALEKVLFLVILEMNGSYKSRKMKHWDYFLAVLRNKRAEKYGRLQEDKNLTQN
ncbi:transposase, IS654 family [Deferribacter desulfuricans SSM1]|uniref:Mutator family transposase n=1 Tax=Deferribacter desulfuricans (strain DSM 14783 / JCM 11476 / NBRC 101012 / SSM1) TaxID=639282 RepID=D3PB19_DEFDS|nr:IS256 family transposase [Deferribacter desulfuricans]BAI79792.1 transposase, IS654 family [Deferribacter desulfuricans SSM1]